jgi:hypothetical protein
LKLYDAGKTVMRDALEFFALSLKSHITNLLTERLGFKQSTSKIL